MGSVATGSPRIADDMPGHFFKRMARPRLVPGMGTGTLLLSMRGIADLVGYCLMYEFEDIIAEITGADRVMPGPAWDERQLRQRLYKAARRLTRSTAIAAPLLTAVPRLQLERTYELFLAIFTRPQELVALNAVPNWRARSRFAACFVQEVWESQIRTEMISFLARFDKLYVGTAHAAAVLARQTGRPCTYVPSGVDALRFSPHPAWPPRNIDVCGIGRRSDITHQALLQAARERGLFYYYDTVRSSGVAAADRQSTFRVSNPAEHRLLYSNLLKRSRYFIANCARANEPAVTRGNDEIAARFFEGAAAGTVMIGDPPRTAVFRELFDWPDAVIPAPFDAPRIGGLIEELDRDPERLARIRRDGVMNTLLRHDWAYRLHTILGDAGMSLPPALLEREASLRATSEEVAAARVK